MPTRSSTTQATAELSSATQDYLKAIWSHGEHDHTTLGTKLLAEKLQVSPSSVSEAMKKLAEQGLVDHARYGAITLTPAGERIAVAMVRRHRLLETYLVQELGYTWDEVHDEAEVLEHAVSDLLVQRIDHRLGAPTRDPHGDPIPAADGTIPDSSSTRLSDLSEGDCAVVERIADDEPELLRHFAEVGIRPEVTLTVVGRRDVLGIMTVRVDDISATLDLGTPATQAIWLRLVGRA